MASSDKRIQQIMEQLMAYARLEFGHQISIEEGDDELAAISAGVNMLGEELEVNTISLREKERLLKELHHRVKNNMQIIVSILRLQTVNETDPKILGFVRDSKNRIDSMALVHEMLYSSDGFEFTELSDYVDFLQRSIFMSYAPPGHSIEVDVNISENCFFAIDKMIPIGLIVNELFSNSLKHAFPSKKGNIFIEAFEDDNGKHHLVFEDDGVGLPEGFNVDNTESLGLQLIHMLTDQLDGSIVVSRGSRESLNPGLKVEIKF